MGEIMELVIHISEISLAVTTPWLAIVTNSDLKAHKSPKVEDLPQAHVDGWNH